MQATRWLAVGCVALLLAASQAFADAKEDATKAITKALQGKWEGKEKKGNMDVQINLNFAKDGKLAMKMAAGGKEFKLDGTYKVIDKGTLELTMTFMGQTKTEKTKFKLKEDSLEITGKDGMTLKLSRTK